jgi:GTP-binding protein HflX
MTVVNETLEDLGAAGKPTLIVFNKIDRLPQRSILSYLRANHPDATFVSATRGINMNALREQLTAFLEQQIVEETLVFGIAESARIALIHEVAEVLEKTYNEETVRLRVRLPRLIAERLAKAGQLGR